MTHEQIKWLTGTPHRDGPVLVEITNGADSFLYPADVRAGQFWFGKIGFGRSKVVGFAYLDGEPVPAETTTVPDADENLLPPHG